MSLSPVSYACTLTLSTGCQALAASSQIRSYAAELALANTATKAGPGGRSSVSGMTATVFGGNGFVGSYVTNELAKNGSQVVVPYRSVETEVMHLKQMGDLGQVVLLGSFDLRSDEAIRYAISRSNVVVNLVGMRKESMNWSFEEVHVDFPARLARIAAESGHVERLIHFSDIAADEGHASERLSSKARGDKLVMQHFPQATILRPGPVVGIEDHFFNYMIYQLSFNVFAMVIDGGKALVQPTYVLDVAAAVTRCLQTKESAGQTYYLGGPEVLSMRQLYDVIIKTLRLHTDDTIHVPAWFAKLMWRNKSWWRRRLPSLPVASYMASVDYVEEVTRDRVAPEGSLGYVDLEIKAVKVTDGLAIEPVRHYRVGGYRWGDMQTVAENVPEHIKKYYNIKT
ncbi:MAG: hypothetical protein WDW36_005064 [Sanguina aurantia]